MLWSIYTVEYYEAVKKQKETLTFCNSMDGPGDYYAKWNNQVNKREMPYNFTYMWKCWSNEQN